MRKRIVFIVCLLGFAIFCRAENIDARQHGAKGDGISDDTAALQKAAQAARGGTLLIPPGRYVLTDKLELRCNIECRGTILLKGEIDPQKTVEQKNPALPLHFLKKIPEISFEPDAPPVLLSPNPFYGIMAGSRSLPKLNRLPLANNPGEVNLREGDTLCFRYTDFFIGRRNTYGDNFYERKEIVSVVDSRGGVRPEFMHSYAKQDAVGEWNEKTTYKRGDYCRRGGVVYKAVIPSGPDAYYTPPNFEKVAIPATAPGGRSTYTPYVRPDGVRDRLMVWWIAELTVEHQVFQNPLTVNNLAVEIVVPASPGEIFRVNGNWVSVKRSNMRFNNLRIISSNPDVTLASILLNEKVVNCIFTDCYISGATFHGLGYNILNVICADMRFENCVSVNCRSGVAGNSCKNMTFQGGVYNKIDDHYGMNYRIAGIDFDSISTAIPGYPLKPVLKDWYFVPAVAIKFSGCNITVENCRFYNSKFIFSSRSDSGDLGGQIILRNLTVAMPGDVYLFHSRYYPDFDYSRRVLTPDSVTIENVVKTAKPGGFIIDVIMPPDERYPIYLNKVGPIVNVQNIGADMIFEHCKLLGTKYTKSDPQRCSYQFIHCQEK